MPAALNAVPGSFDTDHADGLVYHEGGEQAESIAATTDTCHQVIRQSPFQFEMLFFYFFADDSLEIPNHPGIGVRSCHSTDDITCVRNCGDPVAHCLIHCVLEGGGAGRDGSDRGPQQTHAEDVQGLAT